MSRIVLLVVLVLSAGTLAAQDPNGVDTSKIRGVPSDAIQYPYALPDNEMDRCALGMLARPARLNLTERGRYTSIRLNNVLHRDDFYFFDVEFGNESGWEYVIKDIRFYTVDSQGGRRRVALYYVHQFTLVFDRQYRDIFALESKDIQPGHGLVIELLEKNMLGRRILLSVDSSVIDGAE